MDAILSDQTFLPMMTALIASLAATVTDIRSFRIRNTLTVPLCVSGITFHGYMEGWGGIMVALAGVSVGVAVLIVPYLMGILGAGDVKLLMGIGAWLGVDNTALVALFGCVATGVMSAVILARRDGLDAVRTNAHLSYLRIQTIGRHFVAAPVESDIKTMASDPYQRKKLIPFSIMLAIGLVSLVLISSL